MMYCLKCKRQTETTNERLTWTRNDRMQNKGICVVCGSTKNKFVADTSTQGGSIANTLLNKLPMPEIHLRSAVGSENVPGGSFNDTGKYSYCGPFTKLHKRLAEGYKGINELDKACMQHDIAYSKNNDTKTRNIYDDQLAQQAAQIAADPDVPEYERQDARLVAALMAGKARLGLGFRTVP
jgi:Phospholipase A2-like domain/Domain of unknown function (DUF5679)